MIVGIYSDFPQSGKTTAKNIFVKKGFTELSFATTVKESLEVILISLGISPRDAFDYLYGDGKNRVIPYLDCTGGYLMSHYAMFMRETFSEDIWLNTLQNRVTRDGLFVVDDMRFLNEFRYILENGVTVRVIRKDVEKNHGRAAHSEGRLSLENFDYTVHNDGTLKDYNSKIQKIVDSILREHGDFINEQETV